MAITATENKFLDYNGITYLWGNKVIPALNNKADKSAATSDADGLMSASDKTKLDSMVAITNTEINAIVAG